MGNLKFCLINDGKEVSKTDLSHDNVILFLHGWGGGIESFKSAAEKLSRDAVCILVNFKSIEGTEVLNLLDYKNAVIELLENLNVLKFDIVAHSFGARVTFLLAASDMFKNRIDKILLVGAAGIKPRFSVKKTFAILKYKMYKVFYKRHLITLEKLSQFGSSDYKVLDDIMKQTFNNIIAYDCKPLLSDITANVLIVHGKKDTITPFYMAKIINKNINGSKLYKFENLGHFCYLQDANQFNLLAEMFFKD